MIGYYFILRGFLLSSDKCKKFFEKGEVMPQLRESIQHTRIGAKRFFIFQMLTSISLAFFISLNVGRVAGISALTGGMICVIGNGLFIKKYFFYRGESKAGKVIKAFYLGAVIKIAFTMGAFIMIFKLTNISPFPFFLGYIVAQSVFWVAPFLFNSDNLSS